MTVNLIHAIILEADLYDEGMDFNDAAFGDYIVHAIYDCDTETCIFHNDNIHDNPDDFLEGVCEGVRLAAADVVIEQAVIFLEEDEDPYNFIDVCRAIRRYKGVE